MPTPGQALKKSFDALGFEQTLQITKPGQLYGTLFEEITADEIGRGNIVRLKDIANKTLDMQRPFLMIGDIAMFYSEF